MKNKKLIAGIGVVLMGVMLLVFFQSDLAKVHSLVEDGRYEEAFPLLGKLLVDDPENVDLRWLLVESFVKSDYPHLALREILFQVPPESLDESRLELLMVSADEVKTYRDWPVIVRLWQMAVDAGFDVDQDKFNTYQMRAYAIQGFKLSDNSYIDSLDSQDPFFHIVDLLQESISFINPFTIEEESHFEDVILECFEGMKAFDLDLITDSAHHYWMDDSIKVLLEHRIDNHLANIELLEWLDTGVFPSRLPSSVVRRGVIASRYDQRSELPWDKIISLAPEDEYIQYYYALYTSQDQEQFVARLDKLYPHIDMINPQWLLTEEVSIPMNDKVGDGRWNSDGSWLAVEGLEAIYLVKADGSEVVELDTPTDRVDEVHWAPEGNSLIFTSFTSQGQSAWYVPYPGAKSREISTGVQRQEISWYDTRHLIASRDSGRTLSLIDINGNHVRDAQPWEGELARIRQSQRARGIVRNARQYIEPDELNFPPYPGTLFFKDFVLAFSDYEVFSELSHFWAYGYESKTHGLMGTSDGQPFSLVALRSSQELAWVQGNTLYIGRLEPAN